MNKKINVIAEVGSVHDGSFNNAIKLVALASKVGANIVKFQTHIPHSETLKNAPNPSYFSNETRFDYFNRTQFSIDQWKKIKSACDKHSIEFMSSPFSHDAVNMLEDIGVKRYKIASGEVTNIPLIDFIAQTNKPIILSSGMSNWNELDKAVETIRNYNNNDLTIMQCSSQYPCSYENVGLNIIEEISKRYNCNIGFSDHTSTNYASFAAATLGVSLIEKHLTFSRDMYGSDAQFSTEPKQFKDLVSGVKSIEIMLNNAVNKNDLNLYIGMKEVFQKSIVSKCFLKKGSIISIENLDFKKPGGGIEPKNISEVVGKRTRKDIEIDTIIKYEDII